MRFEQVARDNKRRLIPKSLLSRLIASQRDFWVYVKTVGLLPNFFYVICSVFFKIFVAFPFLLVGMEQVWVPHSNAWNIFTFFSVFWRFGANAKDANVVPIVTFVLIGIYVVLLIPFFVLMPIYNKNGRLPTWICYATVFIMDIIRPIVHFWTASQIATTIAVLLQNGYTMALTVALVIVAVIWLIDVYLYFGVILPDIAFIHGRSWTWDMSSLQTILVTIWFNLFFTRLAELAPKGTAHTIFCIVLFIPGCFGVIYVFLKKPCIATFDNGYYIGAPVAFMIISIVQIIRYYVTQLNDNMVIIVAVVLFAFFIMLATMLCQREEIRCLGILEYAEEEHDVEPLLARESRFLNIVRVGFKNGSSYILSWAPFQPAIKKWNQNRQIWHQYLRFLAIYFSENEELISAALEMKLMKFHGQQAKTFKHDVQRTINSRNRQMTRDIKHAFKRIDEKIRIARNLLVTFWTAVDEGSVSTLYDIGEQTKRALNEIESEFLHLSMLYPNNSQICARYAHFLNRVVSDPREAAIWANRANSLRENIGFTIDSMQQFALKMFPLLPVKLAKQNQHNFDELAGVEGTQNRGEGSRSMGGCSMNHRSSSIAGSVNHDNSEASQGGGGGGESDGFSRSQIRELGQNVSLNFITIPGVITVLAFIICFIAGSFVPPIYTTFNLETYSELFKGEVAAANIAESIMLVGNMVLQDALINAGAFLTVNDQYTVLEIASTHSDKDLPYFSQRIPKLLDGVHSSISTFDSMIGNAITFESNAGKKVLTSTVNLVAHTDSTSTPYVATLREAITSVAGSFFQYSPDFSDSLNPFHHANWFQSAVTGTMPLVDAMLPVAQAICDDTVDLFDNLSKTVTIICIAFSIVATIVFPVYMIYIYRIKTKWSFIVNKITSLPHVATQKAIRRFTSSGSDENDQSRRIESKYSTLFLQMASLRDSKTGIPMKLLMFGAVVDWALAIASYLIILFLVPIQSKNLVGLPYRYYYGTKLMVDSYKGCFLLTRSIAAGDGSPGSGGYFPGDTRDSVVALLKDFLPDMIDTLDKWVFAEVNGNPVGILSADRSLVNNLFRDKGPWQTETVDHDRLLDLPPIIMNDFMTELFSIAANTIVVVMAVPKKDDPTYLLYIHMSSNHMSYIIGDVLNTAFQGTLDRDVPAFISTLFVLSAVLMIVGFFMVIILMSQYLRIRNIIRFCLSSLCMIDARYLREATHVMALLAGNFEDSTADKSAMTPALQCVEDKIDEAVIVLNESLHICNFNSSAISMLKLDANMANDVHIQLVIRFEDETVMTVIEQLLDGNDPTDLKTDFETVVSSADGEFSKQLKLSLHQIHLPDSSLQVAIIVNAPDQIAEKLREIEEVKQQIKQIHISLVPDPLLSKVTQDNPTFVAHNFLIVVVEALKFSQFAQGKTTDELTTAVRLWESLIDQCIDMSIVKVRQIGVAKVLAFNLLEDHPDIRSTVAQALEFVTKLNPLIEQNNFQCGYGIAFGDTGIVGMISEHRVLFDVYSSSVSIASTLARRCEVGNVVFSSKVYESLPRDKQRVAQTVNLNLPEGTFHAGQCYMLKL